MKQNCQPIGLYLHIPFCKSKCPYCDFCSFPHPNAQLMTDYVTRLIESVQAWGKICGPRAVDTVYFGGGTPTLLSPHDAGRLTEAIFSSFAVCPDAEVTLECNPATVTQEGLLAWKNGGVNRLSMGAQSAHARELKALGRLHTWQDVCHTVEMARSVGVDNVNLDFMMGIPYQTKDSLLETLRQAIDLSPQHLSAYCLMLEEGTPFARRGAEALGLPDEDGVADLYELASAYIKSRGYEHYEISNYAKEGYRSQHNLHTWQGREYVGIGVAAHGYLDGVRYGNSRDITAFLEGRDITDTRRTLSREDRVEEAVMLGLRLSEGIDLNTLANRFSLTLSEEISSLCAALEKEGLVYWRDPKISLTEKGFLVSNQVIGALLACCL